MSPTEPTEQNMTSSVLRRRREPMSRAADAEEATSGAMAAAGAAVAADGAGAGAAADGAAAVTSGAAAASPAAVETAASTEIIGQELVLASQSLVPVSQRTGQRLEGTGTPQRVHSPGTQRAERDVFHTPSQSEMRVLALQSTTVATPPSLGNRGETGSMVDVMMPPNGQPVSYGPAATPTSMLPLFTPEQSARLDEIHGRGPFVALGRAAPGMEGTGMEMIPRPYNDPRGSPGHMGLHALGMGGGLQGLPDPRYQQEMMWRAQVEQNMEMLGLQLRASQTENFRLREEVKRLLETKDQSRYQTPEDRSSSGRQGRREDGPRGRQVNREEILRAQEELIAAMNAKEDGAEAQQDRSQEDGAETRQVRAQEDGAEAQQVRTEEDGAAAQQENSEEDGAESQQDQEEAEESQGTSSSEDRPEPRSSRRRKSQSEKSTMKVILKLVEGMTNLQKQISTSKEKGKGEEVETVRYAADLPKLGEWQVESSPIDLNDWILCIEPYMADLSTSSEEWWSETVRTARSWYAKHMTLTPIQRLTHHPEPSVLMKERRWSRLERRASSLLMGALPEALKEEVISAKSVTALGILCKSMAQYQPGGLSERTAILSALESPPEATNVQMAVTSLRKWIRWKRRAMELEVSIPDSTILVKGLSRLVKKILIQFPDLNFRLSLVRNALQIDTIPTQESVSQYSEHLLAELEQVCQHARKKESSADLNPKVRKFEEGGAEKEEKRGKGKPREEVESKKTPCKYFLSEAGCRRGKSCPFGHVMDGERRCWNCGSKDHLATQCSRGEEAKPAKVSKANAKNERPKQEAKGSEEKPAEEDAKGEEPQEDTMKKLLDEANRMLKTMGPEAQQKRMTGRPSEDKILGLQRQLDDLKAAALRPFRLSKLGNTGLKGLLDSGATHALRPRRKGEAVNHLPRVRVTLAGDREVEMYLNPHGTIIGDEGTEPIIPMGLLASSLQCRIAWAEEGLVVLHPTIGPLNVSIQDGCPVVDLKVALDLIQQLEQKSERIIRSLKAAVSQEMEWLRKFADEHPVFSKLPAHIKESLVELPAENLWKIGNRHRRKLWKKEGLIIHAFSGPDEGYTLKRAFHECGGDRRLLHECDILHGKPQANLGKEGEGYSVLLRAALDGIVRAWAGGPPCSSSTPWFSRWERLLGRVPESPVVPALALF